MNERKPEGDATELRPPAFVPSASRLRRRVLANRLADIAVRLGGLFVLLAISAIFLVILLESLPLFRGARLEPFRSAALPSAPLAAAFDPESPDLVLVSAQPPELLAIAPDAPRPRRIALETDASIVSASLLARTPKWILGTADGRALVVPTRHDSMASTKPEEEIVFDNARTRRVELVVGSTSGKRAVFAAYMPGSGSEPASIEIVLRKIQKALGGESKSKEFRFALALPEGIASIQSLAIAPSGETLFAGGPGGALLVLDLRATDSEPSFSIFRAGTAAITGIRPLIGEQTIVVTAADGGVSTWRFTAAAPPTERLHLAHDFSHGGSEVVSVAASDRNRTFVSLAADGAVSLHYSTSHSTLAKWVVSRSAARSIALSPKGDEVAVVSADTVESWRIDNPHPEASLNTLFGKVWYEGYSKPEYVWQSSSGSDEFESKLSLVPLIFGTLKGTLFSLLFALPIAILGAIYTAEFMSDKLRGFIKPIVELMAALPSVVIGFIAGLWLAPKLGPAIPGLLVFPASLVLLVALALKVWFLLPRGIRARFPVGVECLLLIPVVLGAVELSSYGGALLERVAFGGDYQRWLLERWEITYDQRNALVVGLAMGFAVVPLIFTISEDALSSVPRHLRAGSMALGASRWQTAVRVTLPAASPGIFSAAMLGFGRAVGETMIVLMATGNTPIMDISPFNGFRALSANIAVELPEAAVGSTLYRILFFAALLLFVMTFIVNTLTELIRQRLRKKYSQV